MIILILWSEFARRSRQSHRLDYEATAAEGTVTCYGDTSFHGYLFRIPLRRHLDHLLNNAKPATMVHWVS